MTYNILTMADDGANLDVAKRILNTVGDKFGKDFNIYSCSLFTLTPESVEKARCAHAVVYYTNTQAKLHSLGELLGLYAELRIVKSRAGESALDIITVCDIYANKQSDHGFGNSDTFGREAYDTLRYSELEIERVSRIAYELAETRRRHITLADKADNLITSRLWRKIVTDINEDYPYVQVNMMCVDDVAVQLAQNTSQFDIILTPSIFADTLSKLAMAHTQNKRTVQTALLGETTLGAYGASIFPIYNINNHPEQMTENSIASAIDIISSVAFMLRNSFDMQAEADSIENALNCAITNLPADCDINTFINEVIAKI